MWCFVNGLQSTKASVKRARRIQKRFLCRCRNLFLLCRQGESGSSQVPEQLKLSVQKGKRARRRPLTAGKSDACRDPRLAFRWRPGGWLSSNSFAQLESSDGGGGRRSARYSWALIRRRGETSTAAQKVSPCLFPYRRRRALVGAGRSFPESNLGRDVGGTAVLTRIAFPPVNVPR